MAIPEVTVSVTDGGTGQYPIGPSAIRVAIGACTAGTVNTIIPINSPEDAATQLGNGTLANYAAIDTAIAGAGLLCVPVAPPTAGVCGTVTQTGGGPAITTSGSPVDGYDVIVTIIAGGAIGTSTYTVSLDGGFTTSTVKSTAASIALNEPVSNASTGVTLSLAAGTYIAGATYKFACFAPCYAWADVASALTAVSSDPRVWTNIHFVGATYNTANDSLAIAGAATFATSVGTYMDTTLLTSLRPARAIVDAPDNYAHGMATSTFDTAMIGASWPATGRVSVGAGHCSYISPLSGLYLRRPASWPYAQRRHKLMSAGLLAEDEGFVGSSLGSLPGINKLWRDERAQPAYHDAKLVSLRTILGRDGYYITSSRTLASVGSDYQYAPAGYVMDLFTITARSAALSYLNGSVRLNANGTIFEPDALAIENAIGAVCSNALVTPRYISPPSANQPLITVNRTDNLGATGLLRIKGRATPIGYARSISIDLGFALQSTVVVA